MALVILAIVAIALAVVLTQESPVQQDLLIDDPNFPVLIEEPKEPFTPPTEPGQIEEESSTLKIIIPSVVCAVAVVCSIIGFVVCRKFWCKQQNTYLVLEEDKEPESLQEQFKKLHAKWLHWYKEDQGGSGYCTLDNHQGDNGYQVFNVYIQPLNIFRNVYCAKDSEFTNSKILWTIRNSSDYTQSISDSSLIDVFSVFYDIPVLTVFEFNEQLENPIPPANDEYVERLITAVENIQAPPNAGLGPNLFITCTSTDSF